MTIADDKYGDIFLRLIIMGPHTLTVECPLLEHKMGGFDPQSVNFA